MLVLGAGISGRGAISLASRLGYDVAVYDRDPAALTDLADITTHSGGWQVEWLETVEVVVASPGIPEHAEPIVSAIETGVPIWGELEFAARHLTAPIVAVTGTNGKTTVLYLLQSILQSAGFNCGLLGTIEYRWNRTSIPAINTTPGAT